MCQRVWGSLDCPWQPIGGIRSGCSAGSRARMCWRILAMTSGSSMQAMTRSLPPQSSRSATTCVNEAARASGSRSSSTSVADRQAECGHNDLVPGNRFASEMGSPNTLATEGGPHQAQTVQGSTDQFDPEGRRRSDDFGRKRRLRKRCRDWNSSRRVSVCYGLDLHYIEYRDTLGIPHAAFTGWEDCAMWLRLKQDFITGRNSHKWGKLTCWQWPMSLRGKRAYGT